MLNDYQKQAIVWDWDAYDDSPEYEFWCSYAAPHGKNVLIPMCAHGKMGVYMAQQGFNVTAFDITPEMIDEGIKRYGTVHGLRLLTADILALELDDNNFDFAVIAGNGDLHLLNSIQDVKAAFISIRKHMRTGGCFALELTLPSKESQHFPKRVFHPRVPNYTDKKVWKENEGRYDANEQRQYIHQTVYIESEGRLESFVQSVCLQYYERDAILEALDQCGFTITGEFSNRQKELWKPGDSTWIVEASAS